MSGAASSTGYFSSLLGRQQDSVGSDLLDSQGNPVFDATALPGSFGAMQARIEDELQDAQTTQQVQYAIIDAIRDYERQSFWFNQIFDDGSLQTVAGQEYYSGDVWQPIATSPHIDQLSVIYYGTRYSLEPRTTDYIESKATNPDWRAMPMDWCYVGGEIRLYPIPDQVYSIRILCTQRFPELSAATDTNCWMIEGERLIRASAKRRLYTHILRDQAMAAAMLAEEQDQLAKLISETETRVAGPRRMRARRF